MNKLDYSTIVESGIPEAAIKRFIDFRKLKKKALTQRSLEMSMREAYKAQKAGITPEQGIDYTIYKGWQGIKAEWLVRDADKIKELYAEAVNMSALSKATRDMTTQEMMSREWAGLEGYTV